jgi:hypothetical protein
MNCAINEHSASQEYQWRKSVKLQNLTPELDLCSILNGLYLSAIPNAHTAAIWTASVNHMASRTINMG